MLETKEKIKKDEYKGETEKMAIAGLHFGHKTSKTHPKMKQFVSSTRNGIHHIDLDKTEEKIKEAMEAVKELLASGKVLLLVGTKIQMKSLTKQYGIAMGLPYVNYRWLGGTFSNYDTMRKRVLYFRDLEKKKTDGELEKYTKKERLLIDKKLRDLENRFGGIKSLDKMPDAVFVLDMKKDAFAIKEALDKKMKVFCIADMDVDPSAVDYFIPANDDAINSVRYILERLKETVLSIQVKPADKE